jgi:WD40 repeat protein
MIWNPADGTLKQTLTGHTHYVLALTTLTNGDIVSGSQDNKIKIWRY